MSQADAHDSLRRMVREVLQEVLPRDAGTPAASPGGHVPQGPEVRRVQVRDDRDLADVVTQVLRLAEDPAGLADLRAGRIRFALVDDGALDDGAPVGASSPAHIDVDRGAVTERLVQRAAREQRPLRIGPRAVLTPLARDRARALGVTISRTDRTSDTSSTQERETR
jgi:hypothetical protein